MKNTINTIDNVVGLHVLMEFNECSAEILDTESNIETAMLQAAEISGAKIIKSVFHKFAPQGVTGVVVIAESHLSIHTWPEYRYAAVDFFTCNPQMDYLAAYSLLIKALVSNKQSYTCVERGKDIPQRYKKSSYEL